MLLSLLLVLVVVSQGCASTDMSPLGTDGTVQLEDDERRLWLRVQEEERRLDVSGQLYEDETLATYVNSVARRLMPEMKQDSPLTFQVKIIKNPLLNAFAYPNGVVYVHTGILARMENEAQLATLLGHEMTHATYRHALKSQRSLKNKTAILASLQTLLVPFGAFGSVVALLGEIGTTAAVTGYSQDLEEEADTQGLEVMVKAGYAPEEAPKLFQHLKKDVEERSIKEPFFFGTHPRLQDRIESYTDLIANRYAGKKGETNTGQFMTHVSALILFNEASDLALGRFSLVETQIRRLLQREQDNAQAHFFLGEVYRQRNAQGDLEKAEEEFRQAVAANSLFAEPHKVLGLIYFKRGHREAAKAEWEQYLGLAPNARDRGYIQQHLDNMKYGSGDR